MIFFDLFSHEPTMVTVSAGNYLFSEGEDGRLMYVLIEGEADVLVHGRVVEKLQHGSIVGELGMVLPGKRSASVLAVSDCEFVEVDEKRFRFLVQQAPYFATEVMAVMAERLRKADQMIPPGGDC